MDKLFKAKIRNPGFKRVMCVHRFMCKVLYPTARGSLANGSSIPCGSSLKMGMMFVIHDALVKTGPFQEYVTHALSLRTQKQD
jgi:hypothetical protein